MPDKCILLTMSEGTDSSVASMILQEPVAMVAKGQAAVLFDNEGVIDGSFIRDSE